MALQPSPSLQSCNLGALRMRFATRQASQLILSDRLLFGENAKQ
jgi:hypothetical protein